MNYKSKCCNASVSIRGIGDFSNKDKVNTYYFICNKCKEACDVIQDRSILLETKAQSTPSVTCNCPNCKVETDITDYATEYLDDGLRAKDIDLQLRCKWCNQAFCITDIDY